jgi:DnaJ domain
MNYYEILGVDRGAEPEVIDAAYRAMMRRYHPDKFSGPKDEAERRAKLLNEAYAVLKDADQRRSYDETLGPSLRPELPSADALPNPDGASIWQRYRFGLFVSIVASGALFAYLHFREPGRKEVPPPVAAAPSPTIKLKAPAVQTTLHKESRKSEPTSSDCQGISCRVLTSFGWAKIEAGATTDSAEHSSGLRIRDDGHYTDVGDGSCLSYEVVGGPKNLNMLVEGGVVTTIEAYLVAKQPVFRTNRGVKLGDPESSVRNAYKGLKQLPDIYSEPPDKKLFYYEPGGERGIKFHINGGKVSGISVGTRSIEYVEGCL